MGIFDRLGPTALTRPRGWGELPQLAAAKASPSPILSGPEPVVTHLPSARGGWFTPTSALTTLDPGAASDGNSAVFACLQALATGIAEPELKVFRIVDGERVELAGTPLGERIAKPNPVFSLDTLLQYASNCLHVAGNAYWRKIRAGDARFGTVLELWPIAPGKIAPMTRPGSVELISYYRYTPGDGAPIELATENVVHFRMGLDDADHRLGTAPLMRLVREISSDQQATRYADRLLANLAINGLSVEWDKDTEALTQAQADEVKARIAAAYGGDNVGAVSVLSPGAKLNALGFSPEQMSLDVLHRVPEERVSAVLRVPAIIAGLGAGLDRATYSNAKEARELFTELTLIPLWRALAATLTLSLVPDYTSEQDVLVDFDLTTVRALADDVSALAERLATLVEKGILTEDEARAELGYPPKPKAAAVVALPALPIASGRDRRDRPAGEGPGAGGRSARILPLHGYEKKAAEDLPREYFDLAADVMPVWEAALIDFLDDQLRRARRALRGGATTAGELIVDGEAILLGETLRPYQLRMLADVSELVVAELGIAFRIDDPATREYLKACGGNIVSITDTTRDAVRAALFEGQAAGEGIPQLASRLAELPAFGTARGRVVARTELGTSQNLAALASYGASKVVVGVRVHDGDYDAACAAMDGRTFTLDRPPAPLEHPNCTRALAPITDAGELSA